MPEHRIIGWLADSSKIISRSLLSRPDSCWARCGVSRALPECHLYRPSGPSLTSVPLSMSFRPIPYPITTPITFASNFNEHHWPSRPMFKKLRFLMTGNSSGDNIDIKSDNCKAVLVAGVLHNPGSDGTPFYASSVTREGYGVKHHRHLGFGRWECVVIVSADMVDQIA